MGNTHPSSSKQRSLINDPENSSFPDGLGCWHMSLSQSLVWKLCVALGYVLFWDVLSALRWPTNICGVVSDLWDDNDGVISYRFAYHKSLNSQRAGTCVLSVFEFSESVLVTAYDSSSSLCELFIAWESQMNFTIATDKRKPSGEIHLELDSPTP